MSIIQYRLANTGLSGPCERPVPAMEFLEGIGQAYEDEIAALRDSLIE